MQIRSILGLVLLMIAAGCREEQVASNPPARASGAPLEATANSAPLSPEEAGLPPAPTKAQPKLRTAKLYVGTNEITAELAISMTEISTGMMWRTNMAEMEGMLFIFARPHQASFWMRNTLLPLTCAYIDPEGTILEIHDMKPRDLTSIPASTDRVQYVLEMNQGWFQRNNVSTGAVISTAHGSLKQTFFGR